MFGACIFCARSAAANDISVCAPEMMRSPSTMSRASAIAIRSFQLGSPEIADVEWSMSMLDFRTSASERAAPGAAPLDILEHRYTIAASRAIVPALIRRRHQNDESS